MSFFARNKHLSKEIKKMSIGYFKINLKECRGTAKECKSKLNAVEIQYFSNICGEPKVTGPGMNL